MHQIMAGLFGQANKSANATHEFRRNLFVQTRLVKILRLQNLRLFETSISFAAVVAER